MQVRSQTCRSGSILDAIASDAAADGFLPFPARKDAAIAAFTSGEGADVLHRPDPGRRPPRLSSWSSAHSKGVMSCPNSPFPLVMPPPPMSRYALVPPSMKGMRITATRAVLCARAPTPTDLVRPLPALPGASNGRSKE